MDDRGSEREVKPFPSLPVLHVAMVSEVAAGSLALISIVWQHVAAVAYIAAIDVLEVGRVQSHVGTASTAFGWVGTFVIFGVVILLVVMYQSIALLDRLTDENGETDGIGDE